jgi:hypothetical protein
VLTARIILDIRDVGNQPGLAPELHTSFVEMPFSTASLDFASTEECEEYPQELASRTIPLRSNPDSRITDHDRDLIELADR